MSDDAIKTGVRLEPMTIYIKGDADPAKLRATIEEAARGLFDKPAKDGGESGLSAFAKVARGLLAAAVAPTGGVLGRARAWARSVKPSIGTWDNGAAVRAGRRTLASFECKTYPIVVDSEDLVRVIVDQYGGITVAMGDQRIRLSAATGWDPQTALGRCYSVVGDLVVRLWTAEDDERDMAAWRARKAAAAASAAN